MLAIAMTPPLWTADLPGIGGRIKDRCEDFEVEEIAAYEPSGEGDHLYLWIEKVDMGAEYFERAVARRLELRPDDIGTAGLKDRRAVTRQWVSVPATVEAKLSALDGDGMRVLKVSRHTNKLKAGHLHGNRFRILIRDVNEAEHGSKLNEIVAVLQRTGMPNYYGRQRFGRDGETAQWGMALLKGEKVPNLRSPFLKKLSLSAAQSMLFNAYLAQRMNDGLFRTVLAGDVMSKYPFGGMFTAEDVATEQARFEAREIVPSGPIFGRKTFPSAGIAAEREATILNASGLDRRSFDGFGKLVMGTRRHNIVYFDNLTTEWNSDGVWVSFALPSGSYATILLREVMKNEPVAEEE